MRARNLKPSLFKNEILATSDPIYAWIFEGLWCLADREGRLEDRPRRIHLEINAGRAYETTENSLAWLAANGFIQRYTAELVDCIQVLMFSRHQKPHQREAPSVLPPPTTSQNHDLGNGSEPSGRESTGNEARPRHDPGMTQAMSSRASSLNPSSLNPLSPFLNAPPTGGEEPQSPPAEPVEVASEPPLTRKNGKGRRKGPLSHTVPETFLLTDELRVWSLGELADLDVEREFSRFHDHEFREPHTDWGRAWKRWVRTCRDTARYARNAGAGVSAEQVKREIAEGKRDKNGNVILFAGRPMAWQ